MRRNKSITCEVAPATTSSSRPNRKGLPSLNSHTSLSCRVTIRVAPHAPGAASAPAIGDRACRDTIGRRAQSVIAHRRYRPGRAVSAKRTLPPCVYACLQFSGSARPPREVDLLCLTSVIANTVRPSHLPARPARGETSGAPSPQDRGSHGQAVCVGPTQTPGESGLPTAPQTSKLECPNPGSPPVANRQVVRHGS